MKIILAVSTILGTVIGAGILGLPYAISVSGLIPGIVLMILLSFSMTLLLLYLGEVVLKCKEVYQLPGLVRKYLGKKTSIITVVLFTLSIYGALISYTKGVSDTINTLTSVSPVLIMTLFTAVLSFPIIKGTKILDKSQLGLMIIKVLMILIISALLIPEIKINNLTSINLDKLFYPFGVIFFSLTGYSVIPELEQVLLKHKKKFMISVITAMITATIIYAIFTLTFIGAYGSNVTQISTNSLSGNTVFFGLILALLSMTTPYIGLGIALKNMFNQDLKINKWLAWALTCLAPLIINLLFQPSFIEPILISGTYSGAITGFIIIKLWFKARNTKGTKPEFTAPLGITGAVIVTITLALGVVMTTLDLLKIL